MIAAERAQRILSLLADRGAVKVTALAVELNVAEETIRRDLARLERAGKLTRTHGGAMPRLAEDLPYRLRHDIARSAKAAIAELALDEVADGMTLMLDSSSTVFAMLPGLDRRAGLTIVTNSVPVCAEPGVTAHTVLSTGGELGRRSMTFTGPMAVAALSRFRADVAFIGAKAVSRDGVILEASLADAEVKQAIIAHARRTVLLADSSKLDAEGAVAVGPIGLVSALVTEAAPSASWAQLLAEEGVRVVVPDNARKS